MLKRTFLSTTLLLTISLCFCAGCQKIDSLFEKEDTNSYSSKNASQSEYTAWIYTPSTRTIQNTMTEYHSPLEFTIDDITVTEHLPKAKNLKSSLENDLNSFIDDLGSDFGDAVFADIDFSALQEQTRLSSSVLQNHIAIDGTLSFIGHYASIQMTATPSIINQNTGETIELYTESDTYYITKFYDVIEKKEVNTEDLFLKDKSYITALEKHIQNKISIVTEEPFNIFKRSFSHLSENDFSLCYDSGLDSNTEPHFLITLYEPNPYCINETTVEMSLSLLLPYLSFSPNEIEDIMDIPNLLTKQFIDTTDTFLIEEDKTITLEDCDNTLFIAIRNYKNQSLTEQINEQLNLIQRMYVNTNPMLNYISRSDDFSLKVIAFKGLGPFLKVFISTNATVNHQNLFNQRNILIHMPSGEQMAVRDLLLKDSIDTLTEQQQRYLDSTDFTLESTGRIIVPLQPPAEDGTMNLVYESKLFDFSKYSNF